MAHEAPNAAVDLVAGCVDDLKPVLPTIELHVDDPPAAARRTTATLLWDSAL